MVEKQSSQLSKNINVVKHLNPLQFCFLYGFFGSSRTSKARLCPAPSKRYCGQCRGSRAACNDIHILPLTLHTVVSQTLIMLRHCDNVKAHLEWTSVTGIKVSYAIWIPEIFKRKTKISASRKRISTIIIDGQLLIETPLLTSRVDVLCVPSNLKWTGIGHLLKALFFRFTNVLFLRRGGVVASFDFLISVINLSICSSVHQKQPSTMLTSESVVCTPTEKEFQRL